MSAMPRSAAQLRAKASVFAALGDETRLGLLARLTEGEPRSIARLTAGTRLTRQAVTKHLHVLEGAGVVRSTRVGRESRFVLDPRPLVDARTYLDHVSERWDNALARLRALVEE
jgi:DNA-binding transcriptional ArsR family regulator